MARKLRLNWSPEQIAGWLKRAHPEDEANRVSHETVYRSLFVQARGVLKKELLYLIAPMRIAAGPLQQASLSRRAIWWRGDGYPAFN